MDPELNFTDRNTANMHNISEKLIGSFLGAAIGDAIGWPFEDRARRISETQASEVPEKFFDWKRRSGSRFLPYEELIHGGSYSDDTQLILATARSISQSDDWWTYFCKVELPLWQIYERGGGGATKRAAESWSRGTAPWNPRQDIRRYFNAGGNGVAMRILPHVTPFVEVPQFDELAKDIMLNGIATHGHPRALLGALLHGYILWQCYKNSETLEFGSLIAIALRDVEIWGAEQLLLPEFSNSIPDGFEWNNVWEKTVIELRELLKIAQSAIELGPLTTGLETLEQFGAFDRKISGAGTVSAVASLFLASRYAVAPMQGLMLAATARGTDTDTIASMAGSILGAINGYEWVGSFGRTVQDSAYIRSIAQDTYSGTGVRSNRKPLVTKLTSKRFMEKLEGSDISDEILFPDGRSGIVEHRGVLDSKTATVVTWRIKFHDGQTIFHTRLKKSFARNTKPAITEVPQPLNKETPAGCGIGLVRVGFKLFVNDLPKARTFYVDELGMTVEKETSTYFTVNGSVSIHQTSKKHGSTDVDFGEASSLCLRVENLDAAYHMLKKKGAKMASPIIHIKGASRFLVLDPSGNIVEIFEAQK